MNKHPALRLAGFVGAIGLCACVSRPAVESYTIDAGSDAVAPRDAVQYFLPRRLVAVTVQRTRTHRDTVTIRALPAVPDRTRAYYARATTSPFHDASFTVRTTATGLLTSVTATSKDETPAIIVDSVAVAALVPELAGFASALKPDVLSSRAPRGSAAPAARPCGALSANLPAANAPAAGAFKATVILDPTDPSDLARAQAELCTRGANYRFVTVPVAAPAADGGRDAATGVPAGASRCSARVAAAVHCAPGVYYRRDEPFIFTIYDAGTDPAAGYVLVSAAVIQTPNLAPATILAMPADAGVATRQSAQFADGMLQSAGATRPSPALAMIALPLQIAKAIVAIPSALFQFRIDTTRDAARLTEAQTEAIKANTARLNALAALQEKDGSAPVGPSASVSADEDRDVQH